MRENHSVATGIAGLQQVFVNAQQWAAEQESAQQIVETLPLVFSTHLPIAFEATAMQLASRALRQGERLATWKALAEHPQHPYPLSAYIGLGMALGQARLDPSPYVAAAPALLGARIWSGYGYYNNSFRKRTTINYLEGQSTAVQQLYWQGVGRSYWHQCKGDLQQLGQKLAVLEESILTAVWRGIGIAGTYLGLEQPTAVEELQQLAGMYQDQLAVGAILASISIKQGHPVESLKIWTGNTLATAQVLHQQTLRAVQEETTQSCFLDWVQKIEQALSPAN